MTKLSEIQSWLSDRLPELLREHQVPGAAVAVAVGDEVIDAAAGVLSHATGVEATPDSVFQIGSITKVWTTTLMMQLVDDGLVDIDKPVRNYLPEFVIADEAAAAVITVRQLLCHIAGFEGDIFTDTGQGEDCLEKYVATLGETSQLFPPGERFSYNNAGFCVLGRVVEVVRDKPFDTCVREHLFGPLGLTHAANGPWEAILHRAAIGHLQPDPTADPIPAPIYALARSNAPAGSMLAMRARDLIAFARMHMNSGRADDGTQVLSQASVDAMQQPQVTLPKLGIMGDDWGLGWEIFHWGDRTVIGHDGGTIGQSAFLRLVPDEGIAVALLTNGGNTHALYSDLFNAVFDELAGLRVPDLPTPVEDPQRIDASKYVGVYRCDVSEQTVTQDADGRIWVDSVPLGELAAMMGGPKRQEMVWFEGDTLLQKEAEGGIHMPMAFVGDDGTGNALYLHQGRAIRRVES